MLSATEVQIYENSASVIISLFLMSSAAVVVLNETKK